MTRPYLGNPKYTIEVLQKYGFVFQKRFGQNFLIDTRVLDRIIEASEITKDDFVLEIGPGIGTMTQYLADAAREVTAVEIDDALIPILQDTLKEWDNVSVIHGDILKTDIRKIADEKNQGRPIKVVANLPYYITTPIIMGLFESHVPVDSITVMVQKEVADRMQTGPGSKDYGALSLAVQYYAKPEIVANVPPNCFMPRPKVGSAVIRLTRHQNPPVQAKDEKLMFRIIRASFNQRRKTLANGLKNSQELQFTKEQVEKQLQIILNLCVSQKEKSDIEWFISNELFHYHDPAHATVDPDNLWMVAQAIRNQSVLEIEYQKLKDRQIVKRSVEPVGLMFSEYYFYLMAVITDHSTREAFHKKNDPYPTIYRLDRIHSIKETGEKFSVPYKDRFKEGEYKNRTQFMFGGEPQKISFNYYGPSVEAVLDKFPMAKVVDEKEGVCSIEAEVFGTGVKMWLLSQGSKVKVTAPETLVQEMKQEIENMDVQYKQMGGKTNG